MHIQLFVRVGSGTRNTLNLPIINYNFKQIGKGRQPQNNATTWQSDA